MSAKESESVQYAQSSEYPLAVLLESELEEKIRQCVENLPEDCRNVYRKSRYEDKSHEQIARESGISINTVKYHIKNALARLKNDLAEYL
jgi:RNA polymerase sigma-70 factor (ECF subfamily)